MEWFTGTLAVSEISLEILFSSFHKWQQSSQINLPDLKVRQEITFFWKNHWWHYTFLINPNMEMIHSIGEI